MLSASIQHVAPSLRVQAGSEEDKKQIVNWFNNQDGDLHIITSKGDLVITVRPYDWCTATAESVVEDWITLLEKFNRFVNGE